MIALAPSETGPEDVRSTASTVGISSSAEPTIARGNCRRRRPSRLTRPARRTSRPGDSLSPPSGHTSAICGRFAVPDASRRVPKTRRPAPDPKRRMADAILQMRQVLGSRMRALNVGFWGVTCLA